MPQIFTSSEKSFSLSTAKIGPTVKEAALMLRYTDPYPTFQSRSVQIPRSLLKIRLKKHPKTLFLLGWRPEACPVKSLADGARKEQRREIQQLLFFVQTHEKEGGIPEKKSGIHEKKVRKEDHEKRLLAIRVLSKQVNKEMFFQAHFKYHIQTCYLHAN